MSKENFTELTEVVEAQHDCSASPIGTEFVSEKFEGQPVWEGIVHIFAVNGHLEATRCYAWSSPIESGTKRRFFAVLRIPPITSAVEAVRAAIVAEHKRGTQ
ncbi:MAG: hypothetical protein IH903_03550 [Proteobacteria bacterium]|nr:hypothetical protein [Pseudomonadota bacterium]